MGRLSFSGDIANSAALQPPLSFSKCIGFWASYDQSKLLLHDDAGWLTYGEAWRLGESLAKKLSLNGIGPGDSFGVLACNSRIHIACLLAADFLALNIVFLPCSLSERELNRVSDIANLKVTVCSGVNEAPIKGSLIFFEELQRAQFDEQIGFPACKTETETLGLISQIFVLSSGSSGRPKLIVNKPGSFIINGRYLAEALNAEGCDKVFVPVPFSHVFGLVGIAMAIVSGASVLTMARYSADSAASILLEFGATVHFGVATMFLREYEYLKSREIKLENLRVGLVAGAGCPYRVFYDWENSFSCKIVQSYGMSETAATLTTTPLSLPVSKRAFTCGGPVEGTTLSIDHSTKEILCRSKTLMIGVFDEEGFHPCHNEDGWFHTGDVGHLDASGMLSIDGRLKDLIIRGGLNICPAEIELLYSSRPDILECSVVSVPDKELGERTCLCVVANAKARSSEAEMRDWAKLKIEKYKVPDYVIFLSCMPRLNSGKVDKIELRERALCCLDGRSSTTAFE